MPLIGISAFGPAYQRMLEQDPHAPGSVDRVLLSRMIRLGPESADLLYGSPPKLPCHQPGSRPLLETTLHQACGRATLYPQVIPRIAAFCASLGTNIPDDIDALRFGGTEEQIITRRSDWCTDIARVACLLCQIAGFPARIVQLFDLSHAYSGHVVVEAHNDITWGLFDPIQGIVYRDRQHGALLSAHDLMLNPSQVAAHYSTPHGQGQADLFRGVAITEYNIEDTPQFDYTISAANPYTRTILEHSQRGWPGGLRWLFDEDLPCSGNGRT